MFHQIYNVSFFSPRIQYDLPLLVELCVREMAANIEVENAARIFYLADLHQLADVKQQACQFIYMHAQQVRQSEGWKRFIKPNAGLLQHLFAFTCATNRNACNRCHGLRFP